MLLNVNTFIANKTNCTDHPWKVWAIVAHVSHYNLEVHSGMIKGNVWKLVSDYLLYENAVSDEEICKDGESSMELKRLELQGRKKENMSYR